MGWFTRDTSAVSEPSITDTLPLVTISPNTAAAQNTWSGANTFSNVAWTGSGTASNVTWTGLVPGGYGSGGYHVNPDLTVGRGGRLNLQGQDADITINGVSLLDTLKTLEQRLNILRPNQELEAEWDQLRELGDQYRRLEAELLDKKKMWDRLRRK
jgi:hypothetical protein